MIFLFWSYLSHFKSHLDWERSKVGSFHNNLVLIWYLSTKVFSFLNWYNQISNWSQFSKPNIPNQNWTNLYLGDIKANLPNQLCKTESTKFILLKKCFNCKEPNTLKQINSIKPTELNPPTQIYQNKSQETKSIEILSKVQFQLEVSLAQLSPSLF